MGALVRASVKVAAVAAVLFFAVRLIVPDRSVQPSSYQTLCVPEGQRAEITLGDNTKVWVNSRSTLIFPSDFSGSERSVRLSGEAYFDVAHDEHKPFVVHIEGYDVRVLGTEFDVRSYPEKGIFETSLIEGTVAVTSVETGHEVVLSPGFKAFDENGRLMVSRLGNHNHLLWREGIISFESETFAEILSKLELYYDAHICIADDSVVREGYTYTGKFWIRDGIEHVLRVLQLDHKFGYRKEGLNDFTIY